MIIDCSFVTIYPIMALPDTLLCRLNTPRKQGGLGNMNIPLLADKTCEIAKSYGVLKEDEGIAFR